MEAKVIYISKSGKAAILGTKTQIAPGMYSDISGWVELDGNVEYNVGDVIQLNCTSVTTRDVPTKDGSIFTKLTIS